MTEQIIAYADLSDEEQRLIDEAWRASRNAYCPYSNFPVGSAVSTTTGLIFSGCNIENAAWTPSVCSERVAFGKAVSEGHTSFRTIAIVCAKKQGGWSCGVCRQFMSEFGLELTILNVVNAENAVIRKTLRELLPDSFGPHSL